VATLFLASATSAQLKNALIWRETRNTETVQAGQFEINDVIEADAVAGSEHIQNSQSILDVYANWGTDPHFVEVYEDDLMTLDNL
jgi:hypothetical protein